MNHLFVLTPLKIKQINQLEPGDVVIWNKSRNTVLRLLPTPSGKMFTVVLEDEKTGSWNIQRLSAERIIGMA